MPLGLTTNQQDLVRIIGELADVLDRSPTIQEIADEYGSNKGNVFAMLPALEERGWLAPRRYGAPGQVRLLHRLPPESECAVEVTAAGVAALERVDPPCDVGPDGAA